MDKAGGYTHTLTPQPDAHTPSVTGDSASSVQVQRPLFLRARRVCLNAVLLSESLGFPFNGRRAFSDQRSLPGPRGTSAPTEAHPP